MDEIMKFQARVQIMSIQLEIYFLQTGSTNAGLGFAHILSIIFA